MKDFLYSAFAIGVVAALAYSLSGCNTAVNDINSVTAALSSPAANQAAANLKAGAAALFCDVGDVSVIAAQIAAAVKANKVIVADTSDVYAVSEIVCSSLGGVVIGPVTVPAN